MLVLGSNRLFSFLAAHYGRFQFAWDAKAQTANKDRLSGTDAVADLIHDIGDAMEEKGMNRKEKRDTNTGWVYF